MSHLLPAGHVAVSAAALDSAITRLNQIINRCSPALTGTGAQRHMNAIDDRAYAGVLAESARFELLRYQLTAAGADPYEEHAVAPRANDRITLDETL